ncbi:YfcE family phosphodiesterase [Bacillus sp. FJAT-27225]|uniref:metallophosphoesterase n=1 Tax=Bacillus sp. FJAT-27225 TaxID=1743144 RepID=UPI00080C3379|nr:metallophosphoesterase [Bacillus sp. FJAT-27225]OCA91289.1 YfcE family phosphodiesterase [Bacillus sp. FJAT-27225]
MKKVLVVSDSHGLADPMRVLKKRHEEVDVFIHCGDSELARDDEALKGFVTVGGNCDFHPGYPDEEVVDVSGKKIFVTHGHLYSVKSTLMNILYKAREAGADIVCFGHSHLLGAEMSGGILFVNPGSIRLPRGISEKTYVILGIDGDKVEVTVYDLEKGELPELKQQFHLNQ